jgi:hypothetical protein
MTSREIIHASEDVVNVLNHASQLGLIIQYEWPSNLPEIQLVNEQNIKFYDRGTFTLYKKEWIFGEPVFLPITAGYNKGKFFQSPRVNIAPITISFDGERSANNVSRLGGGLISCHADWLHSVDQSLRPTPSDVMVVYNSLIRQIDIGIRLRGGVHTYFVLSHAWEKLISGLNIPPFDFIEFP